MKFKYHQYPLQHDIEVTGVTTEDVSAIQVRVGNHTFHGSSKRHPNDRSDRSIGEMLALSRAFTVAAEVLEKTANLQVERNCGR